MTDREILEQIFSKVTKLESQVDENTKILRSLEHNSEVHKAEIDNLIHQVASLSGNVKTIKEAVTKGEEAYNFMQGIKNIFVSKG